MMRFLQRSDTGGYYFTEPFASDKAIPPYAILSHTWGADRDEVTFKDIENDTGKKKPGYEKIRFCAEQAAQDGLQYFWVDTCCINKANYVEVSQAINSMFRWYRNATRCYVYLSDVSSQPFKFNSQPLESDFRKSRWFTRGWTLQELLAPSSVEFFSREGMRLGDKRSLERQIHEIAVIAIPALRGIPLSHFDVDERLSWVKSRQTALEEDIAYSLLGIFDIHIFPIYGEGRENAFKRLLEEIDKSSKDLLQHLYITNPRHDKKRIEEIKGGLLENSYHWILENSDFQRWRDDEQSRLLWIKGDPGKGKTMLLCGIINELNKSMPKTDQLSYFFCQATDSRINNATAVLRGLMYLLVDQQPSLISHIRKKYDHAGKALFEDMNAWVALSEILTDILQDPRLNSTYLIVDALDECVTDLLKLLDFIVRKSCISSRVKWIVSSRNWPDIEERLERAGHKVRLSLELNAEPVSTAVSMFIRHKVLQLAEKRRYDDKTRDAVLYYLSLHANDTFLWVALVCQNLENISRRDTLASLSAFPPGLRSLYGRMVEQIRSSDGASLYKRIVATIALAYRPLTLDELASVVEVEDMSADLALLREIVGLCGSLLAVRQNTVYLVHQSVKDYLLADASNVIFPSGKEDAHYIIFSKSLQVMSRTLRRDIYNLRSPGYRIEQVKQPYQDPLAGSRYSCIYWVDHLCAWISSSRVEHRDDLRDGGTVEIFMRKKYLYWLEALSLCKRMSDGVVSMVKLETLLKSRVDLSVLLGLVRDARRFIMYHKQVIEHSPLQTYASALLFSPAHSLIRRLFNEEEPKWITITPAIRDEWNTCLQTLEGHSSFITSVVFSPNSAWLVSASGDKTIKFWDASNGECLQTLEGHSDWVRSVAFSHDSAQLASASDDKTIKIWNTSSGKCLQTLKTLKGHSSSVRSVAFSHDSARLASASGDKTVKIWDASSGECLKTLEGHSSSVCSVAFSYDSARVASASGDKTVKIWDASSGECLQTLEGHSSSVWSVAFSYDSARVASASGDKTVKIWDASSGECLQTLKGHSSSVWSVAFSYDSARVASASGDKTVKIWDASSGECLQTLEGHSDWVRSVALSPDSGRLASGSSDKTVKIWDALSGECLQTLESYSDGVSSVAFSRDSTRQASGSSDRMVMIWGPSSDECLVQKLEGHSGWVSLVAFSPDAALLASASHDSTVKIWDASSGECLQTLGGHSGWVRSVAFSQDSTRLASTSFDNIVKIWDAKSGECLRTLESHSSWTKPVAFSYDSAWLASASFDNIVKIWDASSGECLRMLKGHSSSVWSVAFSHDSARLASASDDKTVKIWDASSGDCLQTLKGHSSSVCSVAFSHDSAQVASASDDKMVRIWDASSGECLQTLKGHSSSVWSVAFSYDSAQLASASDDKTIKIWNTSSGKCLQTLKTLKGHSSSVRSVAFSHDSARLASASDDKTVKIWDASSGECLQTLKGHSSSVWLVAFSHDDSARVVSASDDMTVRFWDMSRGECLQTLMDCGKLVRSVAFSHDLARLASGSSDNTVQIWDASSGECLQTLDGHSSWAKSVAFSHDSAWLASASFDNIVKIWDASSGECLQTLKGHSSSVWSVAFSHDSARLASASDDKTVKIWSAQSGECLQTLEVGNTLANISFDITGSHLHTDFGTIVIDASASNGVPSVPTPKSPRYQGVGISSDGVWITYNTENFVWLPPEYRPSCLVVSNDTIGIGCLSGKAWNCTVELSQRGAQHEGVLQKQTHYLGERSLTSEFEDVERSENIPTTLQQALDSRDSSALRKLLEHDFDHATHAEYRWLHELVDVGYTWSDIADLLLEEANDAPWIYFDPQDRLSRETSTRSPTVMPRSGADVLSIRSPWKSMGHNVKIIVQQLCGIGGIAPISRSPQDWNGEVQFEKDYSVSYISYASSFRDDGLNGPSTLLSRLKQVLTNFCEAAEVLQKARLCSDYFTIARAHSQPTASRPGRVVLKRVDITMARAFRDKVNQLSLDAPDDTLDLSNSWDIALQILQPLISDSLELFTGLYETHEYLHLFCLTAQFLCLGLVSFCQGHIGPVELFFINRPQELSVMLGDCILNQTEWNSEPRITVSLSQLTCLSKMTEGPLVTFSMSEGWLDVNARIHYVRKNAEVDGVSSRTSRLDFIGWLSNEREHHLEATPNDIVYTWGPGHFIPSDSDESLLRAIIVGDGIIYRKDEFADEFHWEAGFGPESLPRASFRDHNELTVGALVEENAVQCTFPWQECRSRCPLLYLGVQPERWCPNQRQLGLQFGPDHAALQGIQVWTRIPAKLLKQYQLEREQIRLVDFLKCYVGVHVSCCTGVARRISLQKLLADLVPKFLATHLGSAGWEAWNNQYNILAGLGTQDLPGWLFNLRLQSVTAYETVLRELHYILEILEPTGLNRDRTCFQIAWPKEGDLHRGIKIPCQEESLWAQILADSEEGVTFAYMTTACLICTGRQCQQQSKTLKLSTKYLGTAVTRYRNELEQQREFRAWTLKNGESYHMWNTDGYILLKADTTGLEPCLIASKSLVPGFMARRHFRGKRYRSEFLIREHHHPDDNAIDVLIRARE